MKTYKLNYVTVSHLPANLRSVARAICNDYCECNETEFAMVNAIVCANYLTYVDGNVDTAKVRIIAQLLLNHNVILTERKLT